MSSNKLTQLLLMKQDRNKAVIEGRRESDLIHEFQSKVGTLIVKLNVVKVILEESLFHKKQYV